MKNILRFTVLTVLWAIFAFTAKSQTNSIELKDGSGTLINQYNSITAAIAAIPTTITKAYVIEITGTYTGSSETLPIVFPAIAGASATNTITLRPATGVNSTSIATSAAGTVMQFNDADYVIIDGRPGGTGTTKALTIAQTNTGTSTTVQFINGATRNIMRYCKVVNGSTTSAGRAIQFSTSASNPTGNSYNLIESCIVDGGRYGINLTGTSANPNAKNKIYGTEVFNNYFAGIWAQANTLGLEVDSCTFYHASAFASNTTTYGMLFDSQTDSAILTRNTIYGLDVSGTSAIAGIIIRTVSGSNYSRIVNNLISLTKSNNSTSVFGIDIGGTVLTNTDIFYNTIRIGGVLGSGGTSGAIVSAALHKDASNTSNVFDIRNNIFINERSGGNSGTQHIAMAIANISGSHVLDYNTFNASSGNLTRWGTVVSTTIQGHQANVPTGNALNSNDAQVSLVSATDLHIAGGSLGDFALKATPILSVTRDIDNDPRGGSTYRGGDDNPAFPILGKKNEIGVLSIDEPFVGGCSTTQKAIVTVRNFGINQVDTFTVNWSVNGTLQTPVTSYAVLDTVLGSGSITASVSLGSFASTSGVLYDIKAWTSMPNNLNDPDKTNDSAQRNFKMGLASGTYTVGGTAPDYATLKDVADELNNYGICGAVTFNIRTGTYNERISLNKIAGASAINTITFKSETGNQADVVISSPASASAIDNFTIKLNGVGNIIIRDITVERSGSGTYSSVISFDGDAENVAINNCIIRGPASIITDANGTRSNIFGATNVTITGLDIYNNKLENNSNGVWLNTNTTKYSTGVRIFDNTITPNYTGIFVAGQSYPEIYRNKITRIDQTINVEFYGISMNLVNDAFKVERNYIQSNRGYGIRLRDCNGDTKGEGLVVNNIVTMNYAGTSSVFGISNETAGTYQLYAHNTCIINADYTSTSTTLSGRAFYMPTGTANKFSDIRILNNIFYNGIDGVAAYFVTGALAGITEMDYNLLYSASGNLSYISAYLPDMAAHQSASGFDAKSYNFVPTFASSTDGHIAFMQTFAYGRNDLNITVDFDGDVRCLSLPTIGADEYNPGLGLPIASFIGPNAPVTGDRAYFLFNGNANQIALYNWYVDNVLVNKGLNLVYTFPSAGTYEVKMVAENCGGKDSMATTYVINDPAVAPTANFSSDRNQIFINESIQMTDLSLDGPTAWHWSVSPSDGVIFSDSTEQDPIILFTEAGKYEICLIVDNGISSSAKRCRTSYIEVFPQINMCAENSSTYERGKIFDDGGSGSNYAANQNCTFFINPCASEVNLKFTEWTNTDADDKLTIYDGDTTDEANIIAVIAGGMTNPGGNTGFTAKSGRMWLVWKTDATLQYAGFAAEWTSKATSVNPTVANFNIPDTLFEDSPVDFVNTSSGNGLTYFWDFDYPNYDPDDASNYGKTNPTKTFSTTGTYTVYLQSTNCLGSDTATKKVVVVSPTVAPSPVDFRATLTKVNTGEETRFIDLSGNGPSSWKWEVTPSNGVIFLDAETSRKPRVVFNFGGKYTVKLVVANAIGADSIVKTSYIEVLEYCRPNVLSVNTDVTIRRVVFQGIDQSSDYGVSKYSDFTGNNQIGKIAEGGTYTINIERNTNNEIINYAAWIDFNQDGDFDDAGEKVLFDSASSAQILTATINIPVGVQLGQTRMRVGVSRANLTTQPCGPVVVGEFEDYKVNIGADDVAPVITLVGAATQSVEVGYNFTDQGATAFDNVDGNITHKIKVTGAVDTLVVGQYILTYTVSDTVGNTDSVKRIVNITPDVTNPLISLTGADTVILEVFDPYIENGATAIDNPFGTNLNGSVVITGAVDNTKIGTYILTYTVTDNSGNTVKTERVIIVRDTTKPVIVLNGNAVIDHDGKTTYTDAGATVTDNYDAIITYTVSGAVNVNTLGTYTIVYKAVDASGNVADSVVRTINVVDRFAPVIALVGNDIVNLARWQNYADSGYTLSDNFYDSSQVTVDVLGNWVNASVEGLYYIQYRATDLSGNVSLSSKRVIYVNGTNSIPGVNAKSTNVYPNPSNGNFSIEANKAFDVGTVITITNILGAKVYEVTPAQGSQKIDVAMEEASAGVYFVNITTGKQTQTTKIVIR